jgi:hypothetical protein
MNLDSESTPEYNLFSHPFIESVVRLTPRTIKIDFKNGRQLYVLRHPSAIYEIMPMGIDCEGSLLDIHDRDKNRYLIPYAKEEKVRYYIDKIGKMS